MFKQLAEIAKSTSVHLIITSVSDTDLKVLVLPQAKEGVNPALCQPLILTASPDELDEKFVSILTEYSNARKSLEETLEETKLVMEAAGKTAREAATTATKKATANPATPAPAQAATATEAGDDDEDGATTGESEAEKEIDLFS